MSVKKNTGWYIYYLIWFFFITVYFVSIFCSYSLNLYIGLPFPSDFFLIYSIIIIIFSIIVSFHISYLHKTVYLKTLTMMNVMFYFFLLIIGSLFLIFLIPKGVADTPLFTFIGLEFIILGFFPPFLAFIYSWDYFLQQSISEKEFSRFHLIYSVIIFCFSMNLYLLGQYELFRTDTTFGAPFLFFALFSGGDFLSFLLFTKIKEYWKKKYVKESPPISFILSKKFYKKIFIPFVLMTIPIYLILILPFFTGPYTDFQSMLIWILGFKIIILIFSSVVTLAE